MSIKTLILAIAAFLLILYWSMFRESDEASIRETNHTPGETAGAVQARSVKPGGNPPVQRRREQEVYRGDQEWIPAYPAEVAAAAAEERRRQLPSGIFVGLCPWNTRCYQLSDRNVWPDAPGYSSSLPPDGCHRGNKYPLLALLPPIQSYMCEGFLLLSFAAAKLMFDDRQWQGFRSFGNV